MTSRDAQNGDDSVWPTVKISDVCDVVNGYGFPVQFQGRNDLPYPWVKVSDMNAEGSEVIITSAANTVDDEILQSLRARLFPAGTVVFPKVGGALLTNKKRILGVQATFDNNVMGVVPRDVESEWLYFWFQSVDLATLANVQAIPSIRQSTIAALEMPNPSAGVRKRIVIILKGQLAAVERARAAAEAQLEAAKALPVAYLREVFQLRGTKGEFVSPLTAAPLTPAAPAGWRWHLLRDLGRLESGHTPSRSRPEWWGGDIPWIALPDIRALDGRVAHETTEYTNKDGIANSSARILPEGTVCLSRTASVGFVTILGRPMATSQDFVNWVCGPNLAPRFLMHLLIASRDYIRSVSSGAVHKTVYVPTVKEFKVCVPEISGQLELVEILDSQKSEAVRAAGRLEQQLDTISNLPTALLRAAFQGQL